MQATSLDTPSQKNKYTYGILQLSTLLIDIEDIKYDASSMYEQGISNQQRQKHAIAKYAFYERWLFWRIWI